MPATLEFYVVPHPLQDGDLAVVDWRAATEALEAARQGAPLQRVAYAPTHSTAEPGQATARNDLEQALRSAEQRLTRYLLGQRRRIAARGWLWLLVGVALTLLWINVAIFVGGVVAIAGSLIQPGLAALVGTAIGTLGLVPGGPVLALVVGLLPAVWGWYRARPHRAAARRYGHLAQLLRTQRGKGEPLVVRPLPALDAFVTASRAQLEQLRRQLDRLEDEPLPAAGVLADESRAVLQLAHRHGLPALAAPYQELARLSESLERRFGHLERRGGVLDERRSMRAVSRTRGLLRQAVAPYALKSRPADHWEALPIALTIGGAVLAAVYLLAGAYIVVPQQAIVISSPLDRLEQLGRGLGLGFLPVQSTQRAQVTQRPGLHLPWPFEASWPRPFGTRETVSLAPQTLGLQAIVRPIAPPRFELVAVLVQYRIVDPAQWALVSREANIAENLSAGLSQGLQEYLSQRLQATAVSLMETNPQLGEDQTRLQVATYQMVRENMADILVAFFSEQVNAESIAENTGIGLEALVDFRFVEATLGDG